MTASVDGASLSAELGSTGYPAELVLFLRFPEAPNEEARFDFVFTSESSGSTGSPAALSQFRIPGSSQEIFEEILRRDQRLKELIRKGAWPDLYIPALEAKDLVLALTKLEGARVASPAKKLVRAAWLLDTSGDLGNRLGVDSAYALFQEAIRDLEAGHAK